jgi:hypothetical protein
LPLVVTAQTLRPAITGFQFGSTAPVAALSRVALVRLVRVGLAGLPDSTRLKLPTA